MHFELSLNEEIQIYINSGLTPTELFILRLLFLASDGDSKYLINLFEFCSGFVRDSFVVVPPLNYKLFYYVLRKIKNSK